MDRRKTLAILIGGLMVGIGASSARASLITWEFAGEITRVLDDDGSLGGMFTEGTLFSGQYTFESSTPDSWPHVLDRARYADAVTSVSGVVGEVPFFALPSLTGRIFVYDNFDGDSYSGYGAAEFLGAPVEFHLLLSDSTGSVFSDDSLPLSPPDLSLFDSTHFSLELGPDGDVLAGELTSLVPEPGSLALMVVGLSCLTRRRKWRS